MSTLSVHLPTALLSALLLAGTLPAHAVDDSASTAAAGVSKIRVVRLSEVKGAVQMDRNIGRGFEPAIANMPVVEKSQLRTAQGVAEVEFEDNSSLRLAPNSAVEFTRLERTASGATLSSVHVLKGTVYASMMKTTGNDFNLQFGDRTLALPPAAHIRLALEDNAAKVAVLDGSLHIEDASGTEDVPKKKTIVFALDQQNAPQVARNVAQAPFDEWDKQSAEYHARSASYSAFGNSPYTYGLNDMMYYGSFVNSAGCGSMWRPYFASAAWDPYSNGSWAWYQGAGYSWVSPYPWGWTPYHSGNWAFCPGTGWGWTPGGAWSGLNNTAMLLSRPGTPSNSGPRPAPIHPPRVGEPATIAVNTRPLVRSGVATQDAFLFQRDSAGLGIPRDTLGRLDKVSRQTVQKGYALAPVYITGARPVAGGNRPSSTMDPPTLHRGYAPGIDMSEAADRGYYGRPSAFPGGSPGSSSATSAPIAAPSAPRGGPSAPAGGGRPH